MNVVSHQVIPHKSPLTAYDAEGFRRGLTALLPELRTRALRLARQEALADDLVQDTVERAMRFAAQYERGSNLRAWLQQILFSVFVTRYRKTRRERNALARMVDDPSAWTGRDPFAAEGANQSLTQTTAAKLQALPEGFRSVITMVDIESRSYRDAAGALRVPVGTVMSRLHRGRKMLAEMLQQEAA
jgi:RNA polymerase sigma-70 factor (ECF subfamily)